MPKARRRQFLIAATVLLAAPVALAQPAGKMYRVALVFQSAPVSSMAGGMPAHPLAKAFVEALRDFGYAEGRNLVLERRSLEGKLERASDIAAELVRLKVDVIVSASNPLTLAIKNSAASVPIVMSGNFAPVESGLVASLRRPGANVTGLAISVGGESEGQRLELLKEAAPGISRVAFFGSNPNWESGAGKQIQATARALGLTLFYAEMKSDDLASAFSNVTRERADAIFVAAETGTYQHRRAIIDFASKNRLPATYQLREAVEDGGLICYGINSAEVYRRAAAYVDKT